MKKNILHFLFLLSITLNTHASTLTIITPFCENDPVNDFLHEITSHDYFKNAELILISNNVTMKELQVIERYAPFCTLKIILGDASQTMSKIFNCAIQQSTGDFITLMRVEDYRDPQTLRLQIEALENDQTIDIVYCDYHTSYSANTPTDKADNWYLNELPEFHIRWLYRDIPGPHGMWRKSLHQKVGFLKEDFKFHYLWEFWNRCGKHGISFKKVHAKPGTYYFNYFNQKKILYTQEDYQTSYQEEKYIRDTYESVWSSIHYEEKPFVIITASYNNKDWYKWNLDSTLTQNYTNYRIIYIDDKSTDETGKLAIEYAQLLGKQDKISVIINKENKGALANIYHAIHSCKKEEICVIVDGDDALIHPDVLKHLNNIYQDPTIWLTYGQFEWFPTRMPGFVFQVPYWVIERNTIRDYRWVTTHLRTFYAGLFHKIKKEDLMYEGKFYQAASDLGVMYPLVEMAGYHIHFVPEILYSYNTANHINDNKVHAELQAKIDYFIRHRERYRPVENWRD